MIQESQHGWSREVCIHDHRTPLELKAFLERETMVLFTSLMRDEQLCITASASVNGAHYDFELRFVAAASAVNHYTLRVSAAWPPGDASMEEYFRKSSDGWYKMWTRELAVAPGVYPEDNIAPKYQELCHALLGADQHLNSVAAVQQEIISAIKAGGTIGNCHKEGGTNIFWRNGVFVRSDYGDNPDTQTYKSEAEFLQMLWRFCQFDITRATSEGKLSELDGWKLILRRLCCEPGGAAAHGGVASVSSAKGIIATLVLLLIGGGMAAWKFMAIESTGVPLGLAARTPTHVLQLMTTTESYLPSLHRAPGKDRYRIDLLAIPIADPNKQEVFTLIRQQQSNALTPMTKILGSDGDVVWIQALSLFGVNLRTKRVVKEEDLRKANPELSLFLASARPQFTDHLVAVSPDWSQAFAFSLETLKATACTPPSRAGWLDEQSNGRLEKSLCSGGSLRNGHWLAITPMEDAARSFKVGSSLPRDFTANEKDTASVLLTGEADESGQRPTVRTATAVPGSAYLRANFLRAVSGGPIFQSQPEGSVFLLHRQGAQFTSAEDLSRLDSRGVAEWTTPTGIGRLNQVLAGNDVILMIGERPSVPNKVPEPILVLADTNKGSIKTVSLWLKP